MKTSLIIAVVAVVGYCFAFGAEAHPGNTDKWGCHTDKKIGYYHCHKPKTPKDIFNEVRKNEVLPENDGQAARGDDVGEGTDRTED